MARPAGYAAQSAFGKTKAGSETPEQKVERLRKEVGDYQARERGGRSYSLSQPKRSGSVDRQVDPRVLRKQYEEDVRRMQLELHQRYEIQMQKTHLEYQHMTLEINRQRQLQRDRHRQIEDIFNSSDGKGMTVVTISAIPGARVLDVQGTVTGACTMHALPEEATPEEIREAPVNARREAYADLILEARRLGANAIVNFKWRNLHVGYDAVEVTAEGTALKVESDKQDQHCQQCKGGGKGGKNKDHQHNHQQNQQGGKQGKEKQQNQYEGDSDSEEGDSEEEEWNNGQKGGKQKNKNNGKQQGGGKQNNEGGGKGDKNLSTIEQLVKVLMESKIKDDHKSKAEKQKNDFMNMLGKFFEDQQYNTSKEALFEWTKNFDNDNNKSNSKGQGQTHGQKGQSDGWGNNTGNGSGGQAKAPIGWGEDEPDNNTSTSQAKGSSGDVDKPSTTSNDQKGVKGNQQKGKDAKNNTNKSGQTQNGNQGVGKGRQKQDDDPWGASTSTDKPAEPNVDTGTGWGSPAQAQVQGNDAWD